MRKYSAIRWYAVLLLFAAPFLINPAQASAAKDEPPSWKSMDKEELAKLLENGELASVDYVGPNNLEMVSVGLLANATPENVWKVITDFRGYSKLMPEMGEAKVVNKTKTGEDVHFIVTVLKMQAISIGTDYTLHYEYDKPKRMDITWVSGKVKGVNGYWELFPVDGGKKTIVIYAITSDLASANKLVGSALKEQPATVMAINLSSAIVITRLIAEKAATL